MISVYPADAADFANNGLCVLTPTTCTVTETLNGEWDLSMTHPLDDRDKWTYLQVGCIIRAPVPAAMTPRVAMVNQSAGWSVYKITTKSGKLNLRSGPGTNYKRLGQYAKGKEVVLIAKTNNSWYEVTAPDGKRGYMSTEYLTFARTEGSSTTATGQVVESRQLRDQPFRIYRIVPTLKEVEVYARHIFYDLMDNMILSYKPDGSVGGSTAAQAVLSHCESEHDFTMYTDLTVTADELSFEHINPVEAMLGDEGIIGKYSAELARDWYDVYLVQRVGRDTDVEIRQGKNLLGISYDVDESGVTTRIVPTGEDKDGNILYLPEKHIDSPNIGVYPHVKWGHLSVSDAKEDDDTSKNDVYAKLREAAQKELDNGCDLPTVSLDVDFLSVDDTEEYAAFALVSTGENAKSAWISGEQVFKYDKDSNVAPAQITLTANLQNVTMGKWQYKNASGAWTDYPTTSDNASITAATLVVKPTHAIFNGSAASIRITTSDNSIGDTTSIYKVQDGATGATGGTGAAGKNASVVFLTNENITFAGNASGVVTAVTKTANVVAYTGTTKVTPVLGTISGAPTGMTVTAGTASSNEIPLTIAIAANSNLGAAGQLEGTISIPVTSPVSTTLQLRWSKVNTGAAGSAAYVLTIYSPSGTVFTNGTANGGTTITLNAQFFQGATDRTTNSATYYLWQKYVSGSWTTFKAEAAGSSGSTCTVNASDVAGSATFRCRARASSSSTTYFYDSITIIDKTDNYQADIDSTAGDVFKNTVGSTCLICRLWQNGAEVDPPKCTVYSKNAPASPKTGDFYYQIQTDGAAVKLMRYSGSAWVDVTTNATYKHEKTYTWYRRDKDGNPLDSGAAFATGKVIYVDGDDVDNKTVFVCEVE